MKVYCYSKCGTCKKALKWLDERHIEYDKIDIKEEHPDEVAPKKGRGGRTVDGKATVRLPALSWNVIRLEKA